MKEIQLTQGKVALVDDEDFDFLNKYKWHTLRQGNNVYAGRHTMKEKTIKMHRVIMNTPEGMDTDHKDNNGLNNQKSNLRICTRSQNMMNIGRRNNNTSGFKCVSFAKQCKKWMARIQINSKRLYLGVFTTKEEAYEAYREACIKYHGEFANF